MNITAPETLDVGFVLACAAVVFLMQAGFCLVESGLVRSKNSINVAVKNALDCALSILLYTCFVFAVMFGQGGFGVEEVDLGWAARLEKVDDAFCSWWVV